MSILSQHPRSHSVCKNASITKIAANCENCTHPAALHQAPQSWDPKMLSWLKIEKAEKIRDFRIKWGGLFLTSPPLEKWGFNGQEGSEGSHQIIGGYFLE